MGRNVVFFFCLNFFLFLCVCVHNGREMFKGWLGSRASLHLWGTFETVIAVCQVFFGAVFIFHGTNHRSLFWYCWEKDARTRSPTPLLRRTWRTSQNGQEKARFKKAFPGQRANFLLYIIYLFFVSIMMLDHKYTIANLWRRWKFSSNFSHTCDVIFFVCVSSPLPLVLYEWVDF